jgi:hypothetical protein
MADPTQEGISLHHSIKEEELTEEKLRSYERWLYDLILSGAGIHGAYMREILGINPRVFHYHFNYGPPWTKEKERFVKNLLEQIKKHRPGLYEVIDALENHLRMMEKFKKPSRRGTGRT